MSYYPIAVDLTGKPIVVVGGGSVAERKVRTLQEFGARVTVVSPEITRGIEELAEQDEITLIRRGYEPGDIAHSTMVIAATDDRAVNTKVSEDARAAGILVNVVDDPELCSFIVQAVVRRGDLTVSIGTGGKSPALAKRVREVIEKTVGPEYTDLTELMGEMRRLAMEQIPGQPEREKALKQILDSEIIDLLKNGRHREARVLAVHILSHQHPTSNAQYPSCI